MAIVTAGSFSYNGLEVVDRIVVLDQLRFGGVPPGFTVLSRSATLITIGTPDGTVLHFSGTGFSVGAGLTDALTTYTLTGVKEATPDGLTTVWSITGFSVATGTSIIP